MMLSRDSKLDLSEKLATITRVYGTIAAATVIVAGLLMQSGIRQWTGHLLSNVLILGGIIGAPVVSLVGWVGIVLPPRSALHEAAPALFVGALIWLGIAIVGAHMHPRRRTWNQA